MSFSLDCEATGRIENITEDDIRYAFANEDHRGEFIILTDEEKDNAFIQALGQGEEGYILQYCPANEMNDVHVADGELSREEVLQAFLNYFQHNDSWRTAYTWELAMKGKSGCLPLSLAVVTLSLFGVVLTLIIKHRYDI